MDEYLEQLDYLLGIVRAHTPELLAQSIINAHPIAPKCGDIFRLAYTIPSLISMRFHGPCTLIVFNGREFEPCVGQLLREE